MRIGYKNGIIYTGESFIDYFIVEDGTFKEVGIWEKETENNREVLEKSVDKMIDLQGKFVCAGFNDSHLHLLYYGGMLSMPEISKHTTSLKELVEYLKDYTRKKQEDGSLREGAWIKGIGFNQDYFKDEKRFPNRYDLDKVSTEHPICITRACGHSCVVNSKALELLGINKDTKQIEGGCFEVDENGEPLGIFFEKALEMVYEKFPKVTKEEIKEMIVLGCQRLNSYGITSAQSDDYQTFTNLDYHVVMEAIEELAKEEKLTVRINEQVHFTNLSDLKKFVEENNHMRGNEWFKQGPLKMLGDGSLGARTAYLSVPYADKQDTKGIAVYSQEQFDEMCSYANRHGLQIAIHAIGDGILDCILLSYNKALKEHPRNDHRHGIVHCQITRPDQIEQIKDMGLHVYLQSIFLDYDIHIVKERVGEQLASTSYQAKTLLEKGITVSNGSDAPVEEPNVMRGIQCAITRQNIGHTVEPYLAKEALTVKEAIDSFTKYGAYASFEEKQKGQIKEGMFADFIVLEENPFEIDSYRLNEIKVLATYINGKKVYENHVS